MTNKEKVEKWIVTCERICKRFDKEIYELDNQIQSLINPIYDLLIEAAEAKDFAAILPKEELEELEKLQKQQYYKLLEFYNTQRKIKELKEELKEEELKEEMTEQERIYFKGGR